MPVALSQDLRDRVLNYIALGHSCRGAAAHFSISHSAVIRWQRAFKEEQRREAKPVGDKLQKPVLEAQNDWLREQVARDASMTIKEMVTALAQERNVRVSRSMVHRQLVRLGLTFKKNTSRTRANP